MELTYADLSIGRKIRNQITKETAEIEDKGPGGLMLRLLDGPEEGDTIDLPALEVLSFWVTT